MALSRPGGVERSPHQREHLEADCSPHESRVGARPAGCIGAKRPFGSAAAEAAEIAGRWAYTPRASC
eukprot:4758228-Alexandrium_andersonii.AAC.1